MRRSLLVLTSVLFLTGCKLDKLFGPTHPPKATLVAAAKEQPKNCAIVMTVYYSDGRVEVFTIPVVCP